METRKTTVLEILFSVFYWGVLIILSSLFSLVVFAIFPFVLILDPKRTSMHFITCVWGSLCFLLNPFWDLKIEGREKFLRKHPYMVVVNHQSFFDIFILSYLFRNFKWLVKSDLLKIPFVGWGILLNRYIIVRRKNRKSRGTALEKCRDWLNRGVSVVIFPEGTRSPDGQIKDFHLGAFRLAVEQGSELIPIVISGSKDIMPKKSIFLGSRATIRVRVLDPIAPGENTTENIAALSKSTRELMITTLRETSET